MIGFLSGFDLAAVGAAFVMFAWALHTGRRIAVDVRGVKVAVEEVSTAVNGVAPDEDKLIDKVRGLVEVTVPEIQRQLKANHIATISVDTTMHAHGERLQEVGRKADAAQRTARASERVLRDYITAENARHVPQK